MGKASRIYCFSLSGLINNGHEVNKEALWGARLLAAISHTGHKSGTKWVRSHYERHIHLRTYGEEGWRAS